MRVRLWRKSVRLPDGRSKISSTWLSAESVNFVLIAGDLFDGDWKDYHTGLYFISQIHRLKTAGITVFIVSGNHDAAGQMTRSLPYPENVHVFSPESPETRTLDELELPSTARASRPLPSWTTSPSATRNPSPDISTSVCCTPA